ncbi:MAG: M13 family metallopeptidase [Chloroflexi bacterium]|nr:M13 family metallopeptidase [Chloroflexota bacterium]
MSEASRAEAIKTIDSMMVKVGYPESYTSFAKGLVKSPEDGGSLIENAIAIHKAKAAAEHAKATAPVDKTVWALSPQTINAYYEPSLNEIIFPAAMLQPPFYNENASLAQNLGGIGTIIAHEITHAFDDMGSLFDDKGNFRDWWTKEDRQAFTERAAKFVSYFGGIEVLPGQKLDGELTLGENIADSGSLSVITSIVRDDKEALKEMLTSYARIWAAVTTEDDILGQLASDEHAPAKVRVNGVLSVTDAFYEAFDLKPGDKMYVAPENRVKLF